MGISGADSKRLPEEILTFDFPITAAEAIDMLMELTGYKDEKLLAHQLPTLFTLRDKPSSPATVTFCSHFGDYKDANIFGIGVYIRHNPQDTRHWEQWSLKYNAAIGEVTSWRYRADLEKDRVFGRDLLI